MHRNVKRLRIKSRMTSQILKKPRLPQDVLGRGIDLPPFAGRCFDECRLYRRHDENPTYEEVCSDKTDMRKRSRSSLIRQKFPTNACSIFFGKITIRQQEIAKVDVGSQYRSAIFITAGQQRTALSEKEIGKSKRFQSPVVTQIVPAEEFFAAEDYHQQYFEKRGISGSCHL